MDGWNTTFLLGWPIFRCELLVSGRVNPREMGALHSHYKNMPKSRVKWSQQMVVEFVTSHQHLGVQVLFKTYTLKTDEHFKRSGMSFNHHFCRGEMLVFRRGTPPKANMDPKSNGFQ